MLSITMLEVLLISAELRLHKLLKYLIRFRGQIHDSFTLGYLEMRDQDIVAHLRISLPEGLEDRFQEESGLKLTPPPKISLN